MADKRFEPGKGYAKSDWDSVCDNPEWTEADFKKAKPFGDVFPDLAEAFRKRGPVRTKEAISIRLDRDLVSELRASGPGWQSRVNDALRAWIKKGVA